MTRSGLVRAGIGHLGSRGPNVEAGSAMADAALPYWANWSLNITYSGGTTQQVAWFNEALNECTYPLVSLGLRQLNIVWGPLPTNADTRHPYMVTEMNTGDEATIFIATWADSSTAPELQGLPNAQADIKEFYKESVVHELGHVVTYCTLDSPNRAGRSANIATACALFNRIDTGRQGVVSDWDDPSLSWADEIREGIAEAFKCSFYVNRRHIIYPNRTHWTIPRLNWAALLKLWEAGHYDFVDTSNLVATGNVQTQWFASPSTFTQYLGTISPVDWTWMPGGIAKGHFGSFDPGVPTPPTKPPGYLNHGWGTGDETQTWAHGLINEFQTYPPLGPSPYPDTKSRKGRAVLWVNGMGGAGCGAGLTLLNDLGATKASVGLRYDTSLGFGTPTAYSINLGATFRNGHPPVTPPCVLVIDVDADANTVTVGIGTGATDPSGNYVLTDSITGPLSDTGSRLYYPYAGFDWTLLGDDPQYNDPVVSTMSAGPATWTTYPTPVSGPYPYLPAAVVPAAARRGLVRLG